MPTPFVTAVVPSHLVRAGASMGLNDAELMRIACLRPEHWFQFEAQVPVEGAARLAEHCAVRLGRDFGLRAVTAAGEQYSTVWFLAAARETIGDVIDTANHYWPLVRSDYRWRSEVDERRMRSIADLRRPTSLGEAVLLDFDVASLCSSGTVLSGRPLRPLEVRLPIPAPPDPTPWLRLADRVRFDWPHVEIHVDRAVTRWPLPTRNPTLARFLELRLDGLLEARGAADPLASRVRQLLRPHLAAGGLDRAAVARRLGMSERTLLRRLASEGATYRDLLDQVRYEIAASWLADRPVHEVAARLGYADPRAFRRAFQRWAGCTPAEWRDRSP
jgi:AraC-like DNA-binding protein